MKTRVLSYLRLITFSRHACGYLEGQGMVYETILADDTWMVISPRTSPGISLRIAMWALLFRMIVIPGADTGFRKGGEGGPGNC